MSTLSARRFDDRVPTAVEVTVAFVDVVGFTRLCDEASVERIGELVAWLEAAARRASRDGVSFVKLVGDAAMLAGADPMAVVRAVLDILRAAANDEAAPALHAGVASGRALHRDGDWLGRPVNLANHLAAHARGGTVEATAAVARATGGARVWVPIGPVALPGCDAPPAVYRIAA